MPRDIAAGRDDAALAAADDHRPVAQARVVALLDAGVEGVAIDVLGAKLLLYIYPITRKEEATGQKLSFNPDTVNAKF